MINLDGRRILVVEDDYILARDLSGALTELGANVMGPAPTAFYAELLMTKKHIDCAVLDVTLHGQKVFELAGKLRSRGTPIIFATGYDKEQLPLELRSSPVLTKPFEITDLLELISDLSAANPASLEPLGLQFALPYAAATSDHDRLMSAAARSMLG